MSPIQFLLGIQIKRSKLVQKSGFTLIEVLVAMILAVLVITPLLGLMVNILNTDRQEQAKATSEQEIQTALDYIARDLQQAIYIYDAAGITAIRNQLPSPTATDRFPILVFWKREFIPQAITVTGTERNDTFVYSLIAYYLIKDNQQPWSNAARIARWQIRDGVLAESGGVSCTGYTEKYVSGWCPSEGFKRFSLDGAGTLEEKMNAWTKTSATYTNVPIPLVDFIDQTSGTPPSCPTGISLIHGSLLGFYTCIDRANTTAQVFLRGNALARLQNNQLNYHNSKKTYFPTASIRVQGRGFLFTK
ncbi:hormogonium polysaccharide secretion pseudopilin HpsC [Chlorogloeopsis fritschii PCC 9212]|uniref:Prepilin-type N-terminal cleavage/methylation domain-containing protein n=1 Tax=Chlorogloeopsis fritschii PCC 6912 TaxID=211165 RepID=A0A433NF98_CHLFR|nr:hormogonium polysaccharide secretion pseudopilin HpsC [Chlorogloeopsis fritschii]RUR80819.1 hypothetical protein PCC6912_28410 [Chlorogloeopsis fritschii PCC 6912]